MATRSLTLALLLAPCALASTSPADDPLLPRVLKTRFSYKATVPAAPSGAKRLKLWLPIPSDGDYQKVSNLKVVSPVPYEITTESKYGNRMVYVTAVAKPIEVTVSVDVERQEVSLMGPGGKTESKPNLARYLQPDARVPVGGRYAEIGSTVVGARKSSLEKAQAIFDHVIATMQYDYNKESPKLGQGDVAFVCDYKKGNCSDLHSYVISLARSLGVPAYLEYGFPLTGIPVPDPVPLAGKIGGYHCWAWFYDDQKGWLPLDASDGRRWLDANKLEIKDKLVGSLVLERSAAAFSKGRDITLSPPQAAGPLNCFIYPYAEADGKPVEAKWELTYELLSSASGQQDMQGQIDDLKASRKSAPSRSAFTGRPAAKVRPALSAKG